MQIPHRVGKYELLECLGGTASQVYRARDRNLGRTVAFKILSEAGLADHETKARFLAEARLTGSLTHENVIAFYDYGETDQRPFLVMEFLEGESLREQIREGRAGDMRSKLAIARQIASALDKIRSGMAKEGISPEEGGLRLGVLGGGCSGLSYSIRFDTRPRERDRVYEFDGVRLFVDPKSFVYLNGMTLDYEQSLMKQGFNFINPNSSRSCGCGSSFS